MGQPVVLPKFELPGEKPHWAVKAAWGVGGLLLLSIVFLAVAIVHHRNRETQAQVDRAAAIAKVRAEAEAKVAAAAAVARAQREAELAAKAAAAQTVPATTVPVAVRADGLAPTSPAKPVHAHRLHPSRGAKLAKAGGTKPAGKPEGRGSSKPDAIDELLKKMK